MSSLLIMSTESAFASSPLSTAVPPSAPSLSNLVHQLPIIKLSSSNFILWKTQLILTLKHCRMIHHIDGSKPVPPQFHADNISPTSEYLQWEKRDQLVFSWIVSSVSESVIPQIVGVNTAKEAWDKLVLAYGTCGSRPGISELRTQLHHLTGNNNLLSPISSELKSLFNTYDLRHTLD